MIVTILSETVRLDGPRRLDRWPFRFTWRYKPDAAADDPERWKCELEAPALDNNIWEVFFGPTEQAVTDLAVAHAQKMVRGLIAFATGEPSAETMIANLKHSGTSPKRRRLDPKYIAAILEDE